MKTKLILIGILLMLPVVLLKTIPALSGLNSLIIFAALCSCAGFWVFFAGVVEKFNKVENKEDKIKPV